MGLRPQSIGSVMSFGFAGSYIEAAPTQQDFNGLLAALRTAGILVSN